ncbi:hypothetical protein [Bacillus timonensis]|uniref:hypothetical protein n=1 Tax=Bacillus timonensis TaxID=1033734 RepID=UPI0012FAC0E6|nr:hypothetical protein [Bacillus timonensis]
MFYYKFKEVRTPLRIFGIRFYKRLQDRIYFIRLGSGPRRPFLTRLSKFTARA